MKTFFLSQNLGSAQRFFTLEEVERAQDVQLVLLLFTLAHKDLWLDATGPGMFTGGRQKAWQEEICKVAKAS